MLAIVATFFVITAVRAVILAQGTMVGRVARLEQRRR